MSTFLGSAYGTVSINTGGAHSNILGLNNALGMMGGSMLGLNPVTLALGAGVVGLGAAFGGVVGAIDSSVDAADRLETILDGVQANMQITDAEASRLKDTIEDLSLDPDLKVSSFEAAEAVEMLGRNGLDVEEIIGGAARSTVLLANATGGTFAQSADIATDVMALFGIEAENMNKAVDGITSVVNNSKFSINDYALALAQGGGVAAGMGVEFDDFNAAIAGMSQYFSSGSDAGTSFKTMLQRLTPQSKKARKLMQELGIITEDGQNQFYGANGEMRNMANIAGILQNALGDLSEEQRNAALTDLFGTDAMRAALGLMETGYRGFIDLQNEMAETDAAAAASLRMDNLTGDFEILNGVIEALKIAVGDEWLPVYREMTQAATEFFSQHGDKIIAFFSELADIARAAIPAIRDFASNGLDYLLTFWDDIEAAWAQGGLAGVMETIGAYLSSGWNEHIYPLLADWATRFWGWLTGAKEDEAGQRGLNDLLTGITDYLNRNWPRIEAALNEWGTMFWGWAETAMNGIGAALKPLIDELNTWVNSDEAQTRLNELGHTIGNIIYEAVQIALGNQEKSDSVMANFVGILGQAVLGLTDALVTVGAQIVAGIFAGILSGLTGDDYRAMTVNEARALAGDIAGAIETYGWGEVGGGVMKEILKGMAGIDLNAPDWGGMFQNYLGGNAPFSAGFMGLANFQTDALARVEAGEKPAGTELFESYANSISGFGAAGSYQQDALARFEASQPPVEPDMTRAEELEQLRQINQKLGGQANFVVDEERLREQGFINIQDYEAVYQ